jgi:8-oxo-dGTP diphosphatase
MIMADMRRLVRSEIEKVKPSDEIEKNHIADALNWIDSGAEIFRIAKPDKPPKHLVSYFVVIDKKNKSILLVDHINAQLWLPTGGHVAVNEDPKKTVEREAVEELGKRAVYLDKKNFPFFITETVTVGISAGHTDVCLWYLIEGDVKEELRYGKEEFNSVRWFTFDEVANTPASKLQPDMPRFMRKLQGFLAKTR